MSLCHYSSGTQVCPYGCRGSILVCHHYCRTGQCRYGNRCRYMHVQHSHQPTRPSDSFLRRMFYTANSEDNRNKCDASSESPREASVIVDTSSDEPLCCICLQEARDFAMIPCGHLCVCSACNTELVSRPQLRCPLCRTESTGTLRIWR